MITCIAQLKVKESRLPEYLQLAARLTRETLGIRPGCLAYSFNQSEKDPAAFVLYEQWASQDDLNAHISALTELLGPPAEGGLLPEKLMSMYEQGSVEYYRVIE